ncbi:MAG: hypothetical protein M5R36_09905 [Deltaproteobacteria bacterium]|nr:hypothetical protein [Deltaproteobacteria bacterium]
MRKFEDAVGYEELKNWCDTRLCLSREERDGCHAGRVTDLLGQVLREDEAHYYLCGLDTMLFQVSEWLNEREVPKDRVHMEVFFKDQLEAKRRREEMMRRLAERQAQQGS